MDDGRAGGAPNGGDASNVQSSLRGDRRVVFAADSPDRSSSTVPDSSAVGDAPDGTVSNRRETLRLLRDVCVTAERRVTSPADLDSVADTADDGGGCVHRTVDLSTDLAGDYRRFADRVLRPVSHTALTRVDDAAGDWGSYRTVNDQFASTVSTVAVGDAVVWTAGCRLALVPAALRPHVTDGAFLFHYWRDPWPGWDTFRTCPHAEAIVRGLLGSDLVGFSVPRYGGNFFRAVEELLPSANVDRQSGLVWHEGSPTAVRSLPRGVPVDRIQRLSVSRASRRYLSRFRSAHGLRPDRPIVLGIDRRERATDLCRCLSALERSWTEHPDRREAFTVVVVDPDARRAGTDDEDESGVDEDHPVTLVDRVVGRINRRLGTDDWKPVLSLDEWPEDEERYGLYREAAVGFVCAVHDSGIPTTQEFVAAQSADPGVLVLSDRTVTGDRFEETGLTFSPLDGRTFVRRLDEGLRLSPGQRHERMSELRRRVDGYDEETWIRCVDGTIRGVEQRRDRECDASE